MNEYVALGSDTTITSATVTANSGYKLNCRTHRNGLTAMLWQIRFVVASNSTDAHAARPIQSRRSRHPADASRRRESRLDVCFSAAGAVARTALRALK